jgi:hypothetical protein
LISHCGLYRWSASSSPRPHDFAGDWQNVAECIPPGRLHHLLATRSGSPVWFVLEGEKLFLLPVQGTDTQWYRNVLQNPSIRIDARGVEAEFRATPMTDAKAVKSLVEKFRDKYVRRTLRSTIRDSMWRSWLRCPDEGKCH